MRVIFCAAFAVSAAASSSAAAAPWKPCSPSTPGECEGITLWMIPGPNPLVVPGDESPKSPDAGAAASLAASLRSGKGIWDDGEIENAGGVYVGDGTIGEVGTLYWLYHGLPASDGQTYQVGLLTAKAGNYLGPWTKFEGNPILPVSTSKSDWDSSFTASGTLVHDGKTLMMFYEGASAGSSVCGENDPKGEVHDNDMCVGIATSASGKVEGPWTKVQGPWAKVDPKGGVGMVLNSNNSFDPTLPTKQFATGGGFYVANVLYDDDRSTFRMYVEAPIGTKDQGPMALWEAQDPVNGPWKKVAYTIMPEHLGTSGWDQGAYSESSVVQVDATSYFSFYSGCVNGEMEGTRAAAQRRKLHQSSKQHRRELLTHFEEGREQGIGRPLSEGGEQLGFAWSADGVNFTTHSKNPIAATDDMRPPIIAAAEGHALFDGANELIYVFHTLRYGNGQADYSAEDLGVTIFSKRWNFTVPNFRVLGYLSTKGTSGVTIGGGETSMCEYSNKEKQYCAPVRHTIHSKMEETMVINASMALHLTGSCSGSGSQEMTINVYCSTNAEAKIAKKGSPTVIKKISTPCAGGMFSATVPAAKYPSEWAQFTVSNNGKEALSDVELAVTLIGSAPVPGGGPDV